MWGCQHLHALRRAGQERINLPSYFAEIFVKRNNVRVPAAKNQSFVDLHARYMHESVFGKLEVLGNVSVKCCCHKPARPLVGPAVIRTNEVSYVAGIRTTNLGAPMTATVQKHMHGAVAVAYHDHRRATQASDDKISGCGNLCLVSQKNPRVIKTPFNPAQKSPAAYKNLAAPHPPPHVAPTIVLGRRITRSHGLASVKYHLLFKLVQQALRGKLPAASAPSISQAIIALL